MRPNDIEIIESNQVTSTVLQQSEDSEFSSSPSSEYASAHDSEETSSDVISSMSEANSSTAAAVKISKTEFDKLVLSLKDAKHPEIRIDRLQSHNWKDFSYCMMSKLNIMGIAELVESQFEDEVLQTADFKRLNRLAVDQIMLNLDVSIRKDLYNEKSAYELWVKLRDRFEGDDDQRCMRTFRILVDLIQLRTPNLSVVISEFRKFTGELSKLFPGLNMKPFVGLLYSILPPDLAYLPAVFRTQDVNVDKVLEFLERQHQMKVEKKGMSADAPGAKRVDVTVCNLDTRSGEVSGSSSNDNNRACEYCGKTNHRSSKCFKLREWKKTQEAERIAKINALRAATISSSSTAATNNPKVYGF